MAVRPIDANAMLSELRPVSFEAEHSAVLLSDVSKMMREWVERQPTLTPPNEWVSVEERLPEKDGWYLVYAPGYWGNSKIYGLDGLAYSNFKHNYKVHWGIERGTGRGWPGIVTHWMPLPAPPDSRPPEGGEEA